MPLVKAGAVRYPLAINRVRHMVVWVSRYSEGAIYSTDCGQTADSVHDDLVSRPARNCATCIPFRTTA